MKEFVQVLLDALSKWGPWLLVVLMLVPAEKVQAFLKRHPIELMGGYNHTSDPIFDRAEPGRSSADPHKKDIMTTIHSVFVLILLLGAIQAGWLALGLVFV